MPCKAGLVVTNFFQLLLFVLLSILNDNLARQSIMVCNYFFIQHFESIVQFLMAYKVSTEKSADSLMGVSLYVTKIFFLLLWSLSLYL